MRAIQKLSQGDGVRLVSQPLYTLTTKAGQALVIPGVAQLSGRPVDPRRLVLIDGVLHLLDLRFRMLTNRELARAMGFDDEETTYEFVGTAQEITKQIGNAVACHTAAALVSAALCDVLQ